MKAYDSRGGNQSPEILVSIVVPIYNFEEYIEECVTSIQNQTHKNIEIILVDDGSTDSSGAIIDKLAHLDDRIKVLHNTNAGVSAARNSGMKQVTGQFISFVDADDWLSPHFIDFFLREAVKNDAEFILSKNTLATPNSELPEEFDSEVWNSTRAIDVLMYAEIKIGCWNKLFKKSVIFDNNIEFDSRFFMGEGLNFITRVASKSNKTVAIDASLYYYRRDNLKSATSSFSIRKMKNALAAIDNISFILGKTERSTELAIAYQRWHTAFFSLIAFRDCGSPSAEGDFFKNCKSFIRRNSLRLLFAAKISRLRRMLVAMNVLSPNLAVWAYRTLKRL